MKDIKHCSISGVAFTIEIDAYDSLHTYLESIRERYTDNPDGEEILADIEARIAELILAVHSESRVVAKPLIDNIIAQLGSVDEICSEQTSPTGEQETESQNQKNRAKERGKKHLYRNVDDAPIGGVCSGIAAYVGCNAAIVRAIALLLLFFGGASIWVYIILWIVMPAAVTARQKLEMRGEPITVASIKDYYNTIADYEKSRSIISSLLSLVGRIMMIIFKIIMVCILISLILALLSIVIGAFALVAVNSYTTGNWSEVLISIMALCSAAMLLGLGVYFTLQIINSRRIKLKAIVATLIIWFLLTLTTATLVVTNRHEIESFYRSVESRFENKIEKVEERLEEKSEEIEEKIEAKIEAVEAKIEVKWDE
ncbi:MAG: PspC domain-containing protein [Rikenellaceae bacterium]